ncbi:MAG: Amidophosphoribosyltransferase, partial [uncultured Sphingomonas sp.]
GGPHNSASNHADDQPVRRRQVARGVRCFRHLECRCRIQLRRARPPCAAAPRAGSGGDHQLRRPQLPLAPRTGACRGQLRQGPGDPRAAWPDRDRPCPLLHHRLLGPPQRPALVRGTGRGRVRDRAQRQPVERNQAAADAQSPRIHLPVDQRHGSDHPPRRHFASYELARPDRGCAGTGGGRLFASHADRTRPGRVPRSARHPSAGHGSPGSLDHLRLRERRPGRDRRALRARGRAGRDDRGQRRWAAQLPAVRFRPAAAVHLRACLLQPAGQRGRRHLRVRKPQEHRRGACARSSRRGRHRGARARQRRARGDRLRPSVGPAVRTRHHPLALCRTHLHPAEPGGAAPGREAQAQRQQRADQGEAHRADRRLDRPRHHQRKDRTDDARRGRQGSPHAHRLAADPAQLLLRRRYAGARQAARRADGCGGHGQVHQRGQPGVHFDRWPLQGARRQPQRPVAPALRCLLHRRLPHPAHGPDREEGGRERPGAGGEPL